MAQRDKEESELHVSEAISITPCINNGGLASSSCSPRAGRPTRAQDSSAGAQTERAERTVMERRSEESVDVQAKLVNRCFGCSKRVGLTGFRCRCGHLFCGQHRYSDRHECGFDYKAAGRAAIALQNPAVRAAKIVKI